MAYLGEDTFKLGFGLMRLPRLENDEIDIPQVSEMVDMFLEAEAPISTLPLHIPEARKQ